MSGASAPDSVGDGLAAVGEFGLIARIVARLGAPASPAGPGDDAAIVPAGDGRIVVTTDLLAEGIHFRLDWSSGEDVGRRAAAANLADIAAMGAVPTAVLVGIAAVPQTPLAVLDAIADGLRDECASLGAVVVGGDTIRSTDRLTLAVTALGDLQGRKPVTRSGSQPGDDVVLVGRVGWAAAGLALLEAGLDPGIELTDPLAMFVTAHRRPQPPYGAGPALADAGATAMCDVSDGLVADAGHLATSSGVALYLEFARVQDLGLRVARSRFSADPAWEITGGDDHALLATVAPGANLAGIAGLRKIGVVRAGSGVYLDGVPMTNAENRGHDHFG